ncbi:MAG: hypothetical protein EBZ61_07260 [Micrococcales bacterium]|nr:hypothetical protein [Micrococcales bacterium]
MARPRGRAPKPQVLDKEHRVVSLRREGLTWDLIAKEVGYASPSGASDAYYRASYRVVQEDVEQIRHLENERLDFLFNAVWKSALEGDHKAVDSCLRIMARRAKLLGLDNRPVTKVSFTNETDFSDLDKDVLRISRAFDKAQELGLDLFEE